MLILFACLAVAAVTLVMGVICLFVRGAARHRHDPRPGYISDYVSDPHELRERGRL